MTIQALKIAILVLLYCSMSTTVIFGNDKPNFKERVLIVGQWGNKDGEFGKEDLGKTELGYDLDFTVYNRQIYIYDTMNNRVQVFDLSGKFVKKISLKFDWIKSGIMWQFTMLRDHFFALISKPPSYSFMNAVVYKISPNGDFVKEFGSKQINASKEESFAQIKGSEKTENIYCSIGGSSRIAVYDFAGNFVKYMEDIKSSPKIVLNANGKVEKNAPKYCSWMDKFGNYYKIKSHNSHETNFVITTEIQIFPPGSYKPINYEMVGDISLTERDKTKKVRYQGNFSEASFVDLDGKIYHLIALDDGVVLRQIEWR